MNKETQYHTDTAFNLDFHYQRKIFPVDILVSYPSKLGTAQMRLIGTGRDGKDYAIKRMSDVGYGKGLTPAAELFCHELARLVSVPTPQFEFLNIDGELAFGSVWEGGVFESSSQNILKILSGEVKVKGFINFFSKTYALDLFVNNADRHFGNYLFRQGAADSYIPLAFDFGLSWCESGCAGMQALDVTKNTEISMKTIKKCGFFNSEIAKNTLDLISQIDKNQAGDLIDKIPDVWMSKLQKDAISNWWHTPEFNNRLKEIYRHVLV